MRRGAWVRSGASGFATDGFEKFLAGDRGGAALHDHEAAGDVGDVSGFERRRAGSESESVRGENGVAGAGDVDGLIASVNGMCVRRSAGSKRAIPSRPRVTSSEWSFMAESVARPAREFVEILADGGVMHGFELGFVGRGGGDAGFRVGVKIVASVEGDGHRFLPSGLAHQRGAATPKP